MEFMSASEASERWGISLRQVQRLLADNRIPRSQKYGRLWMIPTDVEKPVDLRRKAKPSPKTLSSDFAEVIAKTTIPMPSNAPDSILDIVNEERLRIEYEGELAYLRGDFKRTLSCFFKTAGDDAARIRTSPVAIAAAISMGDYQAYIEIDAYLKRIAEEYRDSDISAFAELALATAAVSILAPNMAPCWLKEGDFSALMAQAKPDALYLRAKYFQCLGNFEAMLAVAHTALVLSESQRGITLPDLYLRMACACACYPLEREADAKRFLLDAMRIALPHGFITPFAESVTAFGGLMEQCLKQEFPQYYDVILGQWKHTWKNWILFHNQFTTDNITLILSLREYHIAQLAANRVPYSKIARQQGISVGRLKNIMLKIYSTLFISSRDELAKFIL